MSIHEDFIPGQWLDTIDVNDFINLNKKTFSQDPIFLEETSDKVKSYASFLQTLFITLDKNPDTRFITIHNTYCERIKENLEKNTEIFQTAFLLRLFELAEEKKDELKEQTIQHPTLSSLLSSIQTTESKKSIKIGLLTSNLGYDFPSFVQPDLRMVPLYGTKQLKKDKKWYVKSLETHLQTHEWIQRRLSLQNEIKSLNSFEQFCRSFGLSVVEPASSIQEVFQYLFLSLLYCFIEAPSVPISFTQLILFIDIYIEREQTLGLLTEAKSQQIIEEFYLSISLIPLLFSPLEHSFSTYKDNYFGETFFTSRLVKTSYRWLTAVKRFPFLPFSIQVVWNEEPPPSFMNLCSMLIQSGRPVLFQRENVYPLKENGFIHQGLFGESSQDFVFDGGTCNLEKVFFLSINGGKDPNTNLNLPPITQPVRGNHLDFEEALAKFKDYLLYVLTELVEMANIDMYLADTYHKHPLRTALFSALPLFHTQFSFSNLDSVLTYLSSIKQEEYDLVRDEKNWVISLDRKNDISEEKIYLQKIITSFIQDEMQRIPLYKQGKFSLCFTRIFPETNHDNTTVLSPIESEFIFSGTTKIAENTPLSSILQKSMHYHFNHLLFYPSYVTKY